MILCIVEVAGKESKTLAEDLAQEVVNLEPRWKKAEDYFDALALLKKNEDSDFLVLVAPHETGNEQWQPFLNALAEFEASSGKTVLKVFYEEPEDLKKGLQEAKEKIIDSLA